MTSQPVQNGAPSTSSSINFSLQPHGSLPSASLFANPTGSSSVIRTPVQLGLERLGIPEGFHGTMPSSSSSSNGPQQGKLKTHSHGKKTKGRVKIKMEFIDNKLRRYTTFSKRKAGLMKKAYELSTLTGTEVMLLVASETGHVYTFATRKLQPMITSEEGKVLIQTCLNSPDLPSGADGDNAEPIEHRMSLENGFDEEGDFDDGDYMDDDDDSASGSPGGLMAAHGMEGSAGQFTHGDFAQLSSFTNTHYAMHTPASNANTSVQASYRSNGDAGVENVNTFERKS
ncbi:hypothetical protein RvY_11109 [Ramazzottius varieornatus]|uniref:Serum response factor homolog n=1 Tax=Ramazzottius varieornatus TaxID=947166 RepID=A0A1D1VF09_RAMVA|nr:hypothetical protein RvY_11109 [Ramazzottius varieornatus]